MHPAPGASQVICPLCDLQQRRSPDGICVQCGADLPSAPEPMAAPAGVGAAPPEEPPSVESGASSGPADDLLDLAIDPVTDRRVRSGPPAGTGLQSGTGGGPGIERAGSELESELRARRPDAFPVEPGRRSARELWEDFRDWVADLPRPSDLPRWARWEIGIGLVVVLLVVLAFYVQEGASVGGGYDSDALSGRLTFPENGWYRYAREIPDGGAEAFFSSGVESEAATRVFFSRIDLPDDHPYGKPIPRMVNERPPDWDVLDPGFLAMGSDELLARSMALDEMALEISQDRGCATDPAGPYPMSRCRYVAEFEEQEFELDLFAFGRGQQLWVALLVSRAGLAAEQFGAAYDVVVGFTPARRGGNP